MKREVKSFVHVRSRTSKKDLEIFEKFKNKNFFDSKEVSHISKLLPEKKINILEIGFGDGNNPGVVGSPRVIGLSISKEF